MQNDGIATSFCIFNFTFFISVSARIDLDTGHHQRFTAARMQRTCRGVNLAGGCGI
jgi:hypothetical protein